MSYSIPAHFHDESIPLHAATRLELWQSALSWVQRTLHFVTKNRPPTKLTAAHVGMILVFAPEIFGGQTVEQISVRAGIPVPEIEGAIRRVRGELFGRVRHPARVTVRP